MSVQRWHRDCLRAAAACGVADAAIERGTHHAMLTGHVQGRRVRIGISVTPHNPTLAIKQVKADIRRAVRRDAAGRVGTWEARATCLSEGNA